MLRAHSGGVRPATAGTSAPSAAEAGGSPGSSAERPSETSMPSATSPGAEAGSLGSSAASTLARPVARRVDGKHQDSGRPAPRLASYAQPRRQEGPRSDGKALAMRKPRAASQSSTARSESAAPMASPSTDEVSRPESPYTQAATVLNEFFARERGTFPPGLVSSIELYFSYGEWGIAHSIIAGVAQKKAASGTGVSPRVMDAAACVLNELA